MSKKSAEMNNLNVSLHSIISGERLDDAGINIPFADDEDGSPVPKQKQNGEMSKSSESLSSNDSYAQEQNYRKSLAVRKRANLKLVLSGNDEASDTDDGNLASEKLDKPGPLISDIVKSVSDAPAIGLRRNSFSMPALNEVDLDALRSLHMNAINDDDDEEIVEIETPDKSRDSFSEIHVSMRVTRQT